MSKRSITDTEIALIKGMRVRGMKNKNIQFYFNRPDRAVNSGRITDIANGKYSNSAAIPAAPDNVIDSFIAQHSGPPQPPGLNPLPNNASNTPISDEAVGKLFIQGRDDIWRLKEGESDTTECKANFGLKHSHQWVKAIAALSNNRGGYVLFGVADGGSKGADGQDLSHAAVGLDNDAFCTTDPAEITNKLRSILDPTPRIEIATKQIGGAAIGVIYVEQHPSRPVIAQKSEGDKIKEGDIFYRYPGQSIRVKYSDLRAMLDQRDRQARLDIMPMVERLLALGPHRALVADLDRGLLDDGNKQITIAPELINQIEFIREGDFNEVEGAPTLMLVGEVVSSRNINSRGVITDDIVINNFLKKEHISSPEEYIRYAVIGSRASWLPIGYFASKAGISKSEVLNFITELSANPFAKAKLLKRISGTDAAFKVASGEPKTILNGIMAGNHPAPIDTKSAQIIAQAITGLPNTYHLDLDDLLELLKKCLDSIDAGSKPAAMSHLRRAVCRVDELYFPLKE